MINTKDIKEKIESDFGDKAAGVTTILEDALSSAAYLNEDRIIRCILFLANKDIEKLKYMIKVAICDPRDLVLWAEYEGHELKRIRDFEKTFDQAEKAME